MLESLAEQGYLVVATPFAVDFDYRKPAAEVYDKFSSAQAELAKEYGELPQMAAGHSLGALMQVLLCTLYPDYGDACAGNALISYNNKPASDAIPLFEQAFVPAFAPLEPLTRNPALLDAKEQLVGVRRLSFDVAKTLAQASPFTSLLMAPEEAERNLKDAEALASLTDQIPDVFSQISKGASEFSPSPKEMRELIGAAYTQRKPLVISFEVDGLDESDALESALPATAGAARTRLPGTHLTPLAARRLLVPSALRPGNLLFDVDGLGALEAQAEEVDARSRFLDAKRATAEAKSAEVRAAVAAASTFVAPTSTEAKDAAQSEVDEASEAVRAAKLAEVTAGDEVNLAAVQGRIAEIEALAMQGKVVRTEDVEDDGTTE